MRRTGIALALCCLPGLAGALTLDLPRSAEPRGEEQQALARYELPAGVLTDGRVPTMPISGEVIERSWFVGGTALTKLQILDPLRDALIGDGFEVLVDCTNAVCGGFDFRFAVQVLPAPQMYVNIFNYQYLSVRHEDGRAVTVLVSRLASDAYVQITQILPEGRTDAEVTGDRQALKVASAPVTSKSLAAQSETSLAEALIGQGHVILDDLDFASGSDSLSEGTYQSLNSLAQFLRADPTRRVALVGHSDAVGALAGNMALSKRRAGSVRARLLEVYGLPADQLTAEGLGYLSPLVSNLTAEGRAANRRVEAVLLNTE